MFYSHLVLTKKGPLGKVWVAATLGESKVPKSYALSCRIHVLCENIEKPAAPFALRLSASLMLGVVRVYSRKSDFVLRDVQAIVDTLKRLDVHAPPKSTSRKRGRDAAPSFSTRGVGPAAISLQDGQDLARLEMITLPISKKRRTRTYALPTLGTSRASRSRTTELEKDREQSVVSLGDISASQAPDLDVAEAMETLFPSVVVPRRGPYQRETSGTPSSGIPSLAERTLLYRAREEDITLAPIVGPFGDLRQELYLGDLPASLESQQPSLLIQPEPELSSGEGHVGIRPFGVGSDVPSSAVGDTLPPLEQDFPVLPEPDDVEPLQIGPFAVGETPSGREGSVVGSDASPPIARVSVTSAKTSPEDTRSKKDVISTSTAHPSTRTKRFARIRFDDVTELSPAQIRASLADTSDIVLADGEERYSRRRGRRIGIVPPRPPFPLSFFPFPESITEMWKELTEGLGEGSQSEPLASQARSPEEQLSSSGARSPGLDEGASVSPLQLQVPLAEEESILVPEVQPPQTTSGHGSVEVLRDGTGRQGTPAVLSHHSRSGSRSFPSRSGSLQTRTARLRDHIFEMITEADERSFRNAREQSSVRRESGRRSDSNVERLRTSGVAELPQAEGNDGRLELRASDFQLVEETEKDDEKVEQKRAPFESIGIHAYKMLELLRANAESRQIPSEMQQEGITTFGALVEDCSRGVTARAFFNLLSLSNSGFICVSQERPYASILISKGLFFRSG